MVVPVTVPDSKFVQSHGFLASVPAARDTASWDRNSNFLDGANRTKPHLDWSSATASSPDKLDAESEQQYKIEKQS